MQHTPFFLTEVPELLQRLNEDSPPLWGAMTAPLMVDHLLAGTQLFMAKLADVPLMVPEGKLDKLRAFLMSDKNFMESAPKPSQYNAFEHKQQLTFNELKAAFIDELKRFDSATKTDPDFWLIHPSFGKLDAAEARQLQFKHIRHHFQQFGLMPR